MPNQSKNPPSNNTSGVVGISWFKLRKTWEVKLKRNGRKIHIGYFKCFLDACCARKSAEVHYSNKGDHNG